jgi:hypothetical protein
MRAGRARLLLRRDRLGRGGLGAGNKARHGRGDDSRREQDCADQTLHRVKVRGLAALLLDGSAFKTKPRSLRRLRSDRASAPVEDINLAIASSS